MDRRARRPKEETESGEMLAFSLLSGQPIIFADPDGKWSLDEAGKEAPTAAPPRPAEG